jgi:nucleoside-diphosphate-sugar epimerase
MAVIVTGANGFIGSHLVKALAEAGDDVRCLVRKPVTVDSPTRARFHPTNFTRHDLGLPDSVFEDVTTVYHLAGATRATSDGEFLEANVGVTERVIDRVLGKPRFVYVSSQAAAGPSVEGRGVRTEEHPPAPVEAYGRSKLAAERAVMTRADKMPVTIVRPVAVYGPGDRDFLSMFRLVRRGLAVYPGIRDQSVATIFVTDLVRGLIAAARSPVAIGKTYFLGSPRFATWREIYAAAGRIVGKDRLRELDVPLRLVRLGGIFGDVIGDLTGSPPLLTTNKAALAAPRAWTCSSTLARTDFEFVARTTLADGLRKTYDWYVDHKQL